VPDNIIELIVKTTDQASQGIKNIAGEVDSLGKSASSLTTIFGGIAAGFTLDKLVESITAAQTATSDLDRQFNQFGSTVGITEEDMSSFADTTSKSTTLTSESLKEAQANLLNYTSLTGAAFSDARDLVVDLAAKMGGDAADAATLLGRALQNPVSGIRLLAQVGVTLTQSQRATIASLEETGGAATAVAFIMDTLKQHLAGAADAAANTLGGALTQLKNSFENGFTGSGSDLQGLTDAIHNLNAEVSDPQFQATLQGMVSFIVDMSTAAIDAVNDIRSLAEEFAHLTGGADTPQGQLEDKQQALQDLIAQPDLDPAAAAQYLAQLDAVTVKLNAMKAAADEAAQATANVNADLGGEAFGAVSPGSFSSTPAKRPVLDKDPLQNPVQTQAFSVTSPTQLTLPPDFNIFGGSALSGPNSLDQQLSAELDSVSADLDKKYKKFLDDQVTREDLVLNHRLDPSAAAKANQEQLDDLLAPINVTAKHLQTPLDDIDKEGKQVAQDLTNAFTSFFESGNLSANNFLKTMLTVFEQILAKAVSMDLVDSLGLSKLFDQPNGSGTQVGGLLGAVGNIFGGSSTSTAIGDGLNTQVENNGLNDDSIIAGLSTLLGFAGGGQVDGGPIEVGEDGPEIFTPGTSGTVTNQREMAFAGGGQGLTYAPVNNIQLTTDNSDKNTAALVTFLTAQQKQQQADFKRQLARNGIALRS
jgi:hypothetical protein